MAVLHHCSERQSKSKRTERLKSDKQTERYVVRHDEKSDEVRQRSNDYGGLGSAEELDDSPREREPDGLGDGCRDNDARHVGLADVERKEKLRKTLLASPSTRTVVRNPH